MLEIELKFQLPAEQQENIINAINQPKPIHLRAQYFDTAERVLSQHAMALRLRQEGEQWVQTFKAKGRNSLERIESDIAIGKRKSVPKLNLALYKNIPTVQQHLTEILPENEMLLMQFETDVQRYIQVITYQDSIIELSVDVGEIRSQGRTQRLSEVEFELKQGHTEQLLDLAQQWIEQYGLWLDVRSKAERGTLLSLQQVASAPVTAKTINLAAQMPLAQALKQIMTAQLEQLLPNLAVVADGIDSIEHRHQARIALRQLHSILKNYADVSHELPKHWLAQIKLMLKVLGTARDADVFEHDILLQLNCVIPHLQFPATAKTNLALLAEQMTCCETQILLLQMMRYAYVNHNENSDQSIKLSKKLLPPLAKLYKRICKQAKMFSQLPSGEQHRLRKQIKRLRYSLKAISSVLTHPKWVELLKNLHAAQQHIGHYHDLEMALNYAKHLKPQCAREQAIDYLHTQQVDAQKRANKALNHLLKSKSPF